MTQSSGVVNATGPARLANLAICQSAMRRAVERPPHLPGMVVHYGPSGWGKSTAAAYVANAYRAYYVEVRSSWTKKALLLAILKEMGIEPARTLYDLTEQVSEQLALSGRPLIIDEMDHLVDKKAVEIVRDIYEGSRAAILMIGEEHLPQRLNAWERFHGRILDFCPALAADLDDARELRSMYCRRVFIADDLLALIHEAANGSVRRICVNLELVQEEAARMGLDAVDRKAWGNKHLYTGEPPKRRV